MVPGIPRRVALLLLLLTPLLAARGRAEEEHRDRLPLHHPVPDEEDWYGVYQERGKVGWAMVSLALEGEGANARYVSTTRVEADLEGMGARVAFSLDARDVFRGQPPFELLSSREVRRENEAERRIALDRQEDGTYGVLETRDGKTVARRFDDLDYTLADRLCHVTWAQSRPAPGDGIRVREFDISELRHDVYRYVVRGVRTQRARGIAVPVLDVDMDSQRLGPLGRTVMDTQGRTLLGPLARVAEMRLESKDQAREERYASDLLAFGRVPATARLGDARTVRRLELAVYGRGREHLASGPRQQVRPGEEEDVLLLLGEDAGEGEPPTAEEVAAALAATPTYPSAREDVRALARQAVGDVGDPRKRVARLVSFVARHVEDANVPSEYSVERLLREPRGDATEHARFFVTLARALGIPAREVRGLVYLGDEEEAFGGHAWCEVAVHGRWQAVDPTWDETAPDATHVAWDRGSQAWVEMLAATRRLTFEVRAVGHGR